MNVFPPVGDNRYWPTIRPHYCCKFGGRSEMAEDERMDDLACRDFSWLEWQEISTDGNSLINRLEGTARLVRNHHWFQGQEVRRGPTLHFGITWVMS